MASRRFGCKSVRRLQVVGRRATFTRRRTILMRTNATCLIHKWYRKAAAGALPRSVVAISMKPSYLPLMLELYVIQSPSQVATSSRSRHWTSIWQEVVRALSVCRNTRDFQPGHAQGIPKSHQLMGQKVSGHYVVFHSD